MIKEEDWMARAISLAQKGEGRTNPNPLVGAVLVKDGRLIGEGYHERRGEAHAERNALAACTEDPRDATLYVTLEPCCHHGRTPPCTEALIAAGVSRVVIGSMDPNPKVAGKGVTQLRQAGIQVETGVQGAACDALNPIFFHYIQAGLPFVAVKYAMTADGKIATRTGASQWITGEEARAHVHRLRNRYRAIMVGSETVLRDDPLLTCRLPGGRNPIRVICDRRLRIPLDSNLCRTAGEVETIVASSCPDPKKKRALEEMGIIVLDLPCKGNGLDLHALMTELAAREVDGILVEGGSRLLASIFEERLAQKLYCYLAPKLFGGQDAPSPVGGLGVSLPQQAVLLSAPRVQHFHGGDLLLEYDIREEF